MAFLFHTISSVLTCLMGIAVAIVLPCHRVVGSNGSLVGYAGGLERKRALLKLEGAA